MRIRKKTPLLNQMWDAWCICSMVGIWPRFIEPNCVRSRKVQIPIPHLPQELKGLSCVHLSDLHFHEGVSNRFLKKIERRVKQANPDFIFFTGDFLCNSSLDEPERLSNFLNTFDAPLGCFAVLGNHDYQEMVGVNPSGVYAKQLSSTPYIREAFTRLFKPVRPNGIHKSDVEEIPPHQGLLDLLEDTPFTLLDNRTVQLHINQVPLHITGLGDYMMKRCRPEDAFRGYETGSTGILLTHNPDSIPKLDPFPSNIILCGHTHWGQVNLPGLRNRFIVVENPDYSRGLNRYGKKWVYTHPGVGSVFRFRCFSLPEVTTITLISA